MNTKRLTLAVVLAFAGGASADHSSNILLTGYWPPTNEMVRRFSDNPVQNPGGWIGGNWEGRGYNVYSYFPEFPGGVGTNPQGSGDLMVDYQDTSTDWWQIVERVRPVAIITFSRGSSGSNWELEARTKNRATWVNDYIAPFQPTPSPPDSSVPAETIRLSTLPMQNMVDAVNQASLGINAFIDSTSSNLAGGFLSEFIGYHGSWYQSLHADPSDPYWCIAAGHLHVGISTPLAAAQTATDITLRELIAHVNLRVPTPGTALALGLGIALISRRRR